MESDRVIIIGLLFVGGTLLAMAIIALVLKFTLNRSMTRKIEIFNQVMMKEMERNLDHFRMSLEEQRVMFNSMRESKTKTLVELYRLFSEINSAGRLLSATRDYGEARRRSKAVATRVAQFYDFFCQNGIVFTEEGTRFVEQWMASNRRMIETLKTQNAFQPSNDEEKQEAIKKINGNWDEFSKQLDDLGAELKEEYNRMHQGIYKMLPKMPK